MRRVAIAFSGPRTIAFLEEEEPPLRESEVRVRTLYSGVSAGTELTFYRNTSPYIHKRWEPAARLFVEDPAGNTDRAVSGSMQYPMVTGYEEVGEIVEAGSGVEDLPTGTIVYGSWGHRSAQVLAADYARDHVLPPGTDPVLGIFSHIGATALNGVLDAGIHLGETVAVFGLGVVGQLAAQLAKLSGARVVGVDLIPARLAIAGEAGIDDVLDGREGPAAERIKSLTEGRGADVCIEASGSTQALNEAIRACAYNSKVVALGFYQGAAQGLYLGEEFHHNRINIVCSQIGGVAPDVQHRWDRPRLVKTFMNLAVQGKLQIQSLVTHIVPANQAAELFRLLDERPSEVLQTVLDFRDESSMEPDRR